MSIVTCILEDCDGTKILARGLCSKHYASARKSGDLDKFAKLRTGEMACRIEGCGRHARSKNLCDKHYTRIRRHGDHETTLRVSKIETDIDKRLRWYGWTERVLRADLGPCWEWNGARYGSGYGIICVGNNRNRTASRVAFETWVRPLADDEYACHRCDNPPCINPAHLFAGSRGDNMQDAVTKNRTAHGEKQGQHKLTADDVTMIRQMYANTPLRQWEIADIYGISQSHVSTLVRGGAWRRVIEGAA